MSALDTQAEGNHYTKLAIQPMQYSMANKLDACQHTAIKYITRFRDKGGKRDLIAAKHCIDLLWEFEYGQAPEDTAKTTGGHECACTQKDISASYITTTPHEEYTVHHTKHTGGRV